MVQVVTKFVDAGHVSLEAHVAHGAVPDVDHVFPASHSNDEGDGDDAEDGGDGAGAVVEDGDGAADGHVSAAQSDTIVKAALLFHASAILRLLHVVSDVAKEKVVTSAFIPPAEGVEPKLVTLVTSHEAKPIPVKLDASLNV